LRFARLSPGLIDCRPVNALVVEVPASGGSGGTGLVSLNESYQGWPAELWHRAGAVSPSSCICPVHGGIVGVSARIVRQMVLG
jgi:hypothetical protein